MIRATLDTGTLLISLSSVSSSGEATSFTAPSAAAQVTATVSHTSTGTPNSIGFGRVQGGSQGSPGTASTAATANFGGQWGAFGDLVMRPNQGTGGADNGEILLEGAAGGSWVVYLGSSLTPRTGSRITLNTPWEGDVSAELGGRDNTFYVMEMATTASARWGGSFQALSGVTVTFEPTTRTWKAYADSVGSGTTFTPLTTDVIVGIGFKVSTTGGIDRLTSLMTAFKLTPATAGLFLDLLSVTGAMIADATITTGKIVSLEAGKISAGTINAVLALANQLQIATGGKLFMGKSAFATAAAGFFLGEDNGYAKFVVGNADGSKQIAWDGANFSINGGLINYGTNVVGDGKPDRYATRNGEGFFDDFGHGNSTTFDDEYYRFAGIGEAAIIDHSWNPSGGKALRLGNNSGNDEYDFVRKMEKAVPIRLNQVYMCRMLVARSAGSAVMYLGVAGVNRYKTEWVSSNGLNELSSQFYWGRSGSMPATTDFIEYVFWFKRTGGAVVNNYSSAVGGTNTPKNPSIIHANAHYACPILYTNYAGATGIVDVAFVEIRPYDPPEWNSNIVGQPSDSAILNSAAIVFDHQPVIAWMSFGTGSTAYSPTSSTQNATIKVRDGDGNIVASRTITATVTFSNGHISVPSDTVSGIQVSVSGNNTTYVTITITYGGKTSTMYALTSITAFGGVGK